MPRSAEQQLCWPLGPPETLGFGGPCFEDASSVIDFSVAKWAPQTCPNGDEIGGRVAISVSYGLCLASLLLARRAYIVFALVHPGQIAMEGP